MPLKLKQRGKVWYLRGTVHGQTVYESTGSYGKEVAEALRIKREGQLVSDHVYGAKETRTFAQAVESYLTAGGDARFIGTVDGAGNATGLLGHFYDTRLKDIRQNDLDAAAAKLYPIAQPETRNRQCYTPFIAVWNHAVKNGWADVRLWSRPKKPKGTNVVRLRAVRTGQAPVDYEHAARFIAAMSPAPAILMTLLFYTGLRPIEAFALRSEDVNVENRWIVLRSSKTGEPRGVPVHDFLAPILASLLKRGTLIDDSRLLRTPSGNPYTPTGEGGGQLKSAISGARRRTDISDISPYTARHTVSTQLVINQIHPYVKDQILGHAVDTMSRRYTHVPQKPLIEAINTLPVPDIWASLPWLADPLAWSGRLIDGTGKRTRSDCLLRHGHASTRTTAAIYDRATLEAAERFADARARHRNADKGPSSMTTPLTREQLEEKLAQAYQVIGELLEDRFETEEGQRLLDYFGRDHFDPKFLPWPAGVAAEL